jgi:hypothetical protein
VGQVEEQGPEEGLHQIPPDEYAQCLADALVHELADALVHESRLCCQGWERTKVLQQIAVGRRSGSGERDGGQRGQDEGGKGEREGGRGERGGGGGSSREDHPRLYR